MSDAAKSVMERHPRLFRWWTRLQILFAVGGGFMGLCLILQGAVSAGKIPMGLYVIFAVFAALFCYGIFAGIRYAENPNNWGHLFLYYTVQVPVFSSPVVSYIFTSGCVVSVGVSSGRIGIWASLGSSWLFTARQMQPWSAALNLFAVGMILSLLWMHARPKAKSQVGVPAMRAGEDPY